jgi:hypothetical protein
VAPDLDSLGSMVAEDVNVQETPASHAGTLFADEAAAARARREFVPHRRT